MEVGGREVGGVGQQIPHEGVPTGYHSAQLGALTHSVWQLYTDPVPTPRLRERKGLLGRGFCQQGRCLLSSVPLHHCVACKAV